MGVVHGGLWCAPAARLVHGRDVGLYRRPVHTCAGSCTSRTMCPRRLRYAQTRCSAGVGADPSGLLSPPVSPSVSGCRPRCRAAPPSTHGRTRRSAGDRRGPQGADQTLPAAAPTPRNRPVRGSPCLPCTRIPVPADDHLPRDGGDAASLTHPRSLRSWTRGLRPCPGRGVPEDPERVEGTRLAAEKLCP